MILVVGSVNTAVSGPIALIFSVLDIGYLWSFPCVSATLSVTFQA